jgi:hypothetical protein
MENAPWKTTKFSPFTRFEFFIIIVEDRKEELENQFCQLEFSDISALSCTIKNTPRIQR